MSRGHQYFETSRARIEIIPMIDIMMFLLVFFMIVTLKMIAGSGIQLELPGSSTVQDLPSVKITIGMKKNTAMYMDGKPIETSALRAKLEEAKRSNKVEVVIAGDKDVSLQALINVMDVVRSAGITSIGIAAKAEATGK